MTLLRDMHHPDRFRPMRSIDTFLGFAFLVLAFGLPAIPLIVWLVDKLQ